MEFYYLRPFSLKSPNKAKRISAAPNDNLLEGVNNISYELLSITPQANIKHFNDLLVAIPVFINGQTNFKTFVPLIISHFILVLTLHVDSNNLLFANSLNYISHTKSS